MNHHNTPLSPANQTLIPWTYEEVQQSASLKLWWSRKRKRWECDNVYFWQDPKTNVLTDSLFAYKQEQYPDGVGTYADFIRSNWLGGRTTDCVGLIKGYGWLDPETLTIGYATNGMPDLGANQMLAMPCSRNSMPQTRCPFKRKETMANEINTTYPTAIHPSYLKRYLTPLKPSFVLEGISLPTPQGQNTISPLQSNVGTAEHTSSEK